MAKDAAKIVGANHSSLVAVSVRFFNFFAGLERIDARQFLDPRARPTLYSSKTHRPLFQETTILMADMPKPGAPPAAFIPEVQHTVAVSSGKGGVGKSTVAVNLALALKQRGAAVGLVDVDVYGPDVPIMMGAKGKPGMFDNKIIPVEAHGIKIMSIGLLVAEREALVWRGPMIHSAVQQFLRDVMWGALDYLVFDMPPGTGDAQLSLSQVVPLTGVVMVTTPQDVALLDVRKALAMFRKLNVPILGIVENMSCFIAPDTGAKYAIFGEGGGDRVAEEFGVPLLARIPLEIDTRKGGDAGIPVVVGKPESAQAAAFRSLADAVVERLGTLSALKLPTIG